MASPWQDYDTLYRLYWDDGLDQFGVADELGCSRRTIATWMDRLDVPTRNHSERENHQMVGVALHDMPGGYEAWTHSVDGTNHIVYVHRLLAVAEYGFDAVAGNFVHHKNRQPFDNRPSNVVPMTASEHGGLHLHGYD